MDIERKETLLRVFRNYKTRLSNKTAEINAYDSWSDEFCRQELKELYTLLITEFKGIDFTQFNEAELKELDFRWWGDNVINLPVWAIDCLEDGVVLTSISGDETIFTQQEDTSSLKDAMMGVTAFGFTRKQIRNSTLEQVLED